jgi:hypothetical protein
VIDSYDLAMLPRDKPLTIHASASGFTCVIRGCKQEAHAWRVTLPRGKGKACPGCAGDHGFQVE